MCTPQYKIQLGIDLNRFTYHGQQTTHGMLSVFCFPRNYGITELWNYGITEGFASASPTTDNRTWASILLRQTTTSTCSL